jgi:metal-responsive CopG/Arc/MetJ family transcriptional regulator
VRTAVSIPDELLRAAERLAKRLKLSRSELYAKAVAEFVEARSAEEVTAALDEVYAVEDSRLDPVLRTIQYASLPKEEW